MLITRRIIVKLLTAFIAFQYSAADKISEYKEYAVSVRQLVWADSLPQFTNTPPVPEKYNTESAIILAAHKSISAKKKTGIGFDRNASLIPLKKVALINMDDYERTLILIKDKAALDDLSEYDMPVKSGSSDWFWQTKDERKYVLGVRIIKPDGRIIDIDTDDYVIASQQKKEDKADRQKLAVPGLEIGDKLDIFLFTHTALKNIQPDPINIMLRKNYPVLSHTISCKIDDDLTTIYRQHNGAPDLTVEQGHDKDYIINGAITEPLEPEPQLLYNSFLQSPNIEMLIYNRRFDQKPPKFARKDGVQANPDAETTIISDYINDLDNVADYTFSVRQQLDEIKGKPMKEVKKKLKNGEWTKTQAADYIYNLLVFSYMTGKYRYYNYTFIHELDAALRQADIKDFKKGITVPRNKGSIDKTIDGNNIWLYLYIPETGQFYSHAFKGYNTSSEIHPLLQGQKGVFQHNKKLSKKERKNEELRFDIPCKTPYDNRLVTTINASVDGMDLNITRRTDAYGAAKNSIGKILTSDNLLQAYLSYLNRDGLVADPQMLRKEKAKNKKQRMERNADEANEQSDMIREATTKYHGTTPKEFRSYEIISSGIGLDPDSSAISYSVDYVMDGLTKNAGRNIIVSIGNLIGEQSEIAPSDRKRLSSDNIILTYPHDEITNIHFQLPQGYVPSATSLDRLNLNIENSTGHFRSKAVAKDGIVEISVEYQLSQTDMPAAEWEKMLELLDTAAKFNTLTLLLEKKISTEENNDRRGGVKITDVASLFLISSIFVNFVIA